MVCFFRVSNGLDEIIHLTPLSSHLDHFLSLRCFYRVQTALAALAAEKQMLMSKLAMVESELEHKRVKAVRKLFQG